MASGEIQDGHIDVNNEVELMGCSKMVFIDDFEATNGGWEGGIIDMRSETLTSFLGPFGKGKTGAKRLITVPIEATRLVVEFNLYEVGQWSEDSVFYVVVGDTNVDLKEFNSGIRAMEGAQDGVYFERKWLQTNAAGNVVPYGSTFAKIHKVRFAHAVCFL